MTQGVMTPLTPLHHLQQHPRAGSQGVGIATLIFRYFLRYFSSTHRTDLSRFRGTFHSFDPVGFAIFADFAGGKLVVWIFPSCHSTRALARGHRSCPRRAKSRCCSMPTIFTPLTSIAVAKPSAAAASSLRSATDPYRASCARLHARELEASIPCAPGGPND